MTHSRTSVLISGASIAGPALALCLSRYGFDVTVVERAPALRGGGQAIDFKGATQRTVLDRMGITDEVLARQTGGTLKGVWTDYRDISMGFHLVADAAGGDMETLMSEFKRAFDYREDPWDHNSRLAYIEVSTDNTTRYIDVQLWEAKDFNPSLDPLIQGHGNPIFPLRAGQPFWYEPDVVTSWSTTLAADTGTILVSNPTDVPMNQKWILTRGDWIVPDVSWEGPFGARVPGVSKLTGRDDSERAIPMAPIGALQGGAVIELDPIADLMVRDAHGTNLLGQMPIPGMFFEYNIPPGTPPTLLPISVTNAPTGGAMAQLVQPRRWQEAIG